MTVHIKLFRIHIYRVDYDKFFCMSHEPYDRRKFRCPGTTNFYRNHATKRSSGLNDTALRTFRRFENFRRSSKRMGATSLQRHLIPLDRVTLLKSVRPWRTKRGPVFCVSHITPIFIDRRDERKNESFQRRLDSIFYPIISCLSH